MNCQVLFVCTGNYYRSRFAEIMFNFHAPQAELNWLATSRGISVEHSDNNVGPIANEALDALLARGIVRLEAKRFPLQLYAQDMVGADLVIALDESEHRSFLEQQFPNWSNKFEYWHVHDTEFVPADQALLQLEHEVNTLIQRLRHNPASPCRTDGFNLVSGTAF